MKIYYRKREERRELTDEEKDIAGNWFYVGFLLGIVFAVTGTWLLEHLVWI